MTDRCDGRWDGQECRHRSSLLHDREGSTCARSGAASLAALASRPSVSRPPVARPSPSRPVPAPSTRCGSTRRRACQQGHRLHRDRPGDRPERRDARHMDRTHRGLPVLGGDLVVHRNRPAPSAGQPDPRRRPCLSTTCRSPERPPGPGSPPAPSHATGRRRHVRRRPPRGRGPSGGTSRMAPRAGSRRTSTPPPERVIRREQQIQTVDGWRNHSGNRSAQCRKSGTTTPAEERRRRGNTYTTDMEQQVRLTTSASCSASARHRRMITSTSAVFGNGTGNNNRASASADAQYGNETGTTTSRPSTRDGIFGNGTRLHNPRPLHGSGKYVNAFWDGTRMTYGDGDGNQWSTARLARRRRARDEPRRHREHGRPDLLPEVGRPERT